MNATPKDADRHGRPLLKHVNFKGAIFDGEARFDEAIFEGDPHFDKATFQGDAHFPEAEFRSHADFSEATFARAAHFPGVTVEGDARFREASLKEAFVIGPMLVCGVLVLDGASFNGIEIRVSAGRLLCQRTQFHGPANLRIRWAEAALDGAVFESASLLGSLEDFDAFHPPERGEPAHPLQKRLRFVGELEGQWRQESERSGRTKKPRLVSLRGANVANLVVSDVDLGACLFVGAANLDGLRIEGSPSFPSTPAGRSNGSRLFARRWSPRQTVAEEHHWRAQHGHGAGWEEGEVRGPDWLARGSKPPDAEQIAGIYRALRKGREDNKDAPGAADFYYGEMEMRRHAAREAAKRRPGGTRSSGREGDARLDGDPPGNAAAPPAARGERLILWLYWLVSGYGLRASRALLSLALTVLLFAGLRYLVGLKSRDGSPALLQSLEGAAFRRGDETVLNERGQYLQLPLHLLGPLFLGLALLSLRGRVKR